MSIAGYLSAGKPEVRMRKNCGGELGARFDGAVLTGQKSVDAGIAGDAVRHTLPEDEHYRSVEDYDPVLRAHCRQ